MKIIIFLLMLVFLSCNNDIVKDAKLIGKRERQVIKKYGVPRRDTVVSLTKGVRLLEYQSSLYDLYHLKESDTIKLRELFWDLNQEQKLVVWLEKREEDWIVVDNLIWKDNVQF